MTVPSWTQQERPPADGWFIMLSGHTPDNHSTLQVRGVSIQLTMAVDLRGLMLDENMSILKGYTPFGTSRQLEKTLFSRGQLTGQPHLDNPHISRLMDLEFSYTCKISSQKYQIGV